MIVIARDCMVYIAALKHEGKAPRAECNIHHVSRVHVIYPYSNTKYTTASTITKDTIFPATCISAQKHKYLTIQYCHHWRDDSQDTVHYAAYCT